MGNDNAALESPCFGMGWDGLQEEACKECSAQPQCKDKFVNGIFWEFVSNPENEKKSLEDIGINFSISTASAEEAMNSVKSILSEDKDTKGVEIVEATVKGEKQSAKVVEGVKSESVKVGPVKARRGRRPSDLITCPECNGTGGTADNVCEVCGGYGDISASKYEVMQKKKMKSEKQVVKQNAKEAVSAVKRNTKKVADPAIDNPKTSVVEVKNSKTGEAMATWSKFPFSIFDLKELSKKEGVSIDTHIQSDNVVVVIQYKTSIDNLFK